MGHRRIHPDYYHYFLVYMGINSLEELPDVSDLEIVQEETELFLERNELENEN